MIEHSPEWEKLFSALGRVTFAWSAIDTFLDIANHVLYHQFGGKEIESVLPHTSLGMKIEFFRRCVAESPKLEDHQKTFGNTMGAQLAKMADERHWIIHGLCTEMAGETLTLIRSRLKLEKTETKKVTYANLEDFYVRSVSLGMGLPLFLIFNLRQLPRESQQDFLRTLREKHGATFHIGEKLSDLPD